MPNQLIAELPNKIVVMKVGLHPGEDWHTIARRKHAEERAVGCIHWGYSGAVLHPTRQVQPFVRSSGGAVELLIIEGRADVLASPATATVQSSDGLTWEAMPRGVVATGEHALILNDLRPSDEWLDLGQYEVGAGLNAGVPLPNYFRGRVDKACARLATRSTGTQMLAQVLARARLVHPYAVLLKT